MILYGISATGLDYMTESRRLQIMCRKVFKNRADAESYIAEFRGKCIDIENYSALSALGDNDQLEVKIIEFEYVS